MAAENEDIQAVKDWLANEVKLERYADKLVSNGYISLEICCNIDENALDKIGIVLPYHRRRFLGFVEKLREKLGMNFTDKDNGVMSNTELISNGAEEGSEQEKSLIRFDSVVEGTDVDDTKAVYVNVEDDVPRLPPKVSKRSSGKARPPPIPPRRDLEEGTSGEKTVHPDTPAQGLVQQSHPAEPYSGETIQSDTQSQALAHQSYSAEPSSDETVQALDLVQQSHSAEPSMPMDAPKKKAPVKPPRRTIIKAASESKLGVTPGISLPTTASNNAQEPVAASVSNDAVAIFDPLKADETPADVNSTSGFPGLPKPLTEDVFSKTSEEPAVFEGAIYGNTEVIESHSTATTEPKRPVSKLPTRAGSKKPVPMPRTRGKSEDGILVTALVRNGSTTNDDKEESPPVLNHSLQPRTKSFSMPENKKISSEDKPSTLPRYPAVKRVAPPPPPSRQTSSSLKDKRGFPNMPLPPVPPMERSVKKQQDEVDGDRHQGTDEVRPSPDSVKLGPESDYESIVEPAIYEAVNSREESGDADYSSDDSLDGLVDDIPEFSSKVQRDGSVDSTDECRISMNILSPRVRKSDGFLWKQGGQQNNKGWRKRWFVFNGTDLRYYKEKNNLNESLHIIPVSQIQDIEPIKDAKRPTFKVVTPNRIFILASESTTEMNLWSQTLMEAVIFNKRDDKAWKSGGDMCDPDKEGWLKKQGHNVVADWKKRYVAVKDDKICYYDTHEDFVYATPINCINAALAKVKTVEGHKNRFVVITFNKSYSFQGESEFDAASWIIAIETAIQIGLGDRAILEKVWENPRNRYCADCGMKDPVWASVNFCVCVCAKCIGIHRNLGVHCSRARSLLMDEKIWNPTLVELMIKIGNDKANQLLEHKLPEDDKITPEADSSARREFIYSKYWEKKYCKYHQAFGDADTLGKFLRDTVLTDDVLTTMELILNKVDVRYVPSDVQDEKTPLELAEDAGQTLQAELLRQNGGEGKLEMQNSSEEPVSSEYLVQNPTTIRVQNKSSTHFTMKLTSQSIPVVEVVYEKEGFLYRKEGTWKKKWFLLKDRHLKYARGPHEKDDLATIDLATVISLVKWPKGELLQMDIVTNDKTHSLKADTEEELEAWYSALRSKQVFGVLLSQQELGSDGIPHLVAKCLQFVETYGGLEMEGVYRVNGGQLTMKKLKTSFDQDAGRVLLSLDECGVHDVTGVLKQYLRQLPDPVIPGHMYKQFIAASMNQDRNTRLMAIKDLINQLPKVNHDTLKEIIFHLTKVVELVTVNKMGVPNVAMIFGPTLMSNENTGRMDDASINQEFSIIGEMIENYQWLFDVGEEDLRKDQVIQLAKKKLRELNEAKEKNSTTGGEFTLDIYVKEKNDNPCRLKVSSEMTAGRVCAEIVSQMKLPRDTDWVLYEVIDDGAMERAFQVREKVLAAAKFGSLNYLIVKENYIAEQIAPHVGWLSMEGTLYIREPKKSWKPSHVCLKNGYLLVNKERGLISKATKAEQWPLHKLTIYVGVPAEKATKGVDTSCGFTVVVKTDQEEITRYLCVKDKRDMYRWLAAILNMKHPEGIWSDPSQEAKGQQAEELPMYLGRQSMILRRKGSSRGIMEELKVKQKSLRQSSYRDSKK